jgi:ABC-2 type transport system permease protein
MRFWQTLTAVTFKEFITVFRDRTALFFMFFPPLVQIIAFGFALDMDIKHMYTVVLDEDRTKDSRAVVDTFVSTGSFRVVGEARSIEELREYLRAGKARVGIQIPPDFSQRLRRGEGAQVQVLIDGSNSTPALQALNTSLGVGFRYSLLALAQKSGVREVPLEIRPQVLYNPGLRSQNFFIPGVIGLALQIATVFSTALAVVRERERGTLEQLLISPISRPGLMLGKILPYFTISAAMSALLFWIMRGLFDVPIAGDLWALIAATLVYIFTLLSLGLLISTVAENTMQSFQMTLALILPSVFFSGLIFPRETMPWIFYAIGEVLPATYFIDLVRAIVVRGARWSDYARELSILCGMGAFIFAVCSFRFRRTLG